MRMVMVVEMMIRMMIIIIGVDPPHDHDHNPNDEIEVPHDGGVDLGVFHDDVVVCVLRPDPNTVVGMRMMMENPHFHSQFVSHVQKMI
jgi:hypothetical protein